MSNEQEASAVFEGLGEALASSAPSAAVQMVEKLADEAKSLDEHIKELEELLKQAKGRANHIKVREMPDALAQLGTSEWVKPDGSIKIKLQDFLEGTMPKEPEARNKALAWVIAHDGEELIKTEVNLMFGKGDHNLSTSVIEYLRSLDLEPDVKEGIHAQTYLAWVRERLRKGEPTDLETLGLFNGRQAKITFPLETKRK